MSKGDRELKKNGSGYSDPTAYGAIKNIEREEKSRFYKLLNEIFEACEAAGFHLENHIVVTDLKTGRVWK